MYSLLEALYLRKVNPGGVSPRVEFCWMLQIWMLSFSLLLLLLLSLFQLHWTRWRQNNIRSSSCFFLKFLLTTLSVALQMNFMLLIQILHQHQALMREVSRAIEEKNRALKRYNQLRNKFLRRRARRQWKNPGRTDKW